MPGIIRNRARITAVIENAKAALASCWPGRLGLGATRKILADALRGASMGARHHGAVNTGRHHGACEATG